MQKFNSLRFSSDMLNQNVTTYLLNIVQKKQDRICMIDSTTNNELSLTEFINKSLNLAAELQYLGSKPDTIVGIISENRIEYPIISLAVMLTGATLTCFNPGYTEGELQHTFNISKPTIIFCSQENLQKIKKLREHLLYIKKIILIDDSKKYDENVLLYSDMIQKSNKKFVEVISDINDTVIILYSSGTTGYPKGVMLTHKNIVYMLKIIHEENLLCTEGNIAIGTVPMYHAYGFFVNLMSLILDQTLIIIRKFEEKLFLSLIQKFKPKFLFLVPPLVVFLLKDQLADLYDLSSVKYIICGAAPLSILTETEIKRKLGLKNVQQAYGMTEATLLLTVKRKNNNKTGTCGSVVPGVEVKIIGADHGNTLKANEIGELCFRGPNIMKGYINNEQATAETVDGNGWLHTGDIGYYDDDNDFFVVDRLKELIKYKGYQVAPAELEDLLLGHPCVQDAAVIGIPNEIAGELPKAFVVRKYVSKITENELINYISKKVSSQKKLRGGVMFIEEIPKNPSGKILRKNLRELHKTMQSKY